MITATIAKALGGRQVGTAWMTSCPAHAGQLRQPCPIARAGACTAGSGAATRPHCRLGRECEAEWLAGRKVVE
jgi:hypothetical protein